MIHTSLAKPLCHWDESSALMEFKRSFRINRTYPDCVYPKVESWSLDGHGDCCSWDGVECDKATGYVTSLDLSSSCLFGTITSNTSLFRLLHLESLNLAWNDFNSSSIPYGFGNFSRLHNLNLSNSKFSGKIPSDISWLSRLISLDLSSEWGFLELPNVGNFVQNFTVLRELDLSYVNMSSPFPHVLANFSYLKSLKLAYTSLHGRFPVSIFQLPKLEVLEIKDNPNLSGFIPTLQWGNRLRSLSFGGVNFSGEIPVSIGNLVFLNKLSISDCNFSGSLPTSLSNLSRLAYLDISQNKFHGQIPASLANLTQLSSLDLSYNNLTGDIWHWLVNLSKLTQLFLSGNSSTSKVLQQKKGYVEIQLAAKLTVFVFLHSTDVQVSAPIPSSFKNLTRLVWLSLSNNNWQGEIPNSLWELKDLEILQLRGNNLSGTVDLHEFKNLWYMDLSHNSLTGFGGNQFNLSLPKLNHFDIGSNQLKTKLPSLPPSVAYCDISNNFLFGDIQPICRARSLVVLNLSINSLNGTIPSCLGNIKSLSILDLGKNKLEGMSPHAYPKGCALKMIDVTENRLQGLVPRSLANCKMLEYLNLGYNKILDGFPLWVLELTKLKALILNSNEFHGPIETYRSQFNLSNLHILDLSNNSFNGELPTQLLLSLNAMRVPIVQDQLEYMNTLEVIPSSSLTLGYIFNYGMKLMNKGIEREYSKVPFALMHINLSHNKFKGHIPHLIGDLKLLLFLNLSSNILTGCIPPSLANLTKLESLDLSQNNLSGEIPQQLVQLTFLSSFNVSHNQLVGLIPHGSQFNTFGIDSFATNEKLYGRPLPNKCTKFGDNIPLPPSPQEETGKESSFNLDWKFVLIGTGVGFLIGVLLGNLIIDEKSKWFLHYSQRMEKRWK
ncbi:hypothetical protein BT93_E0896 [Corymbia citriodora subsp. variegata]|nr:hypothetical protein BT93_E0896 [Corymbia citriodora subsp. variegata]